MLPVRGAGQGGCAAASGSEPGAISAVLNSGRRIQREENAMTVRRRLGSGRPSAAGLTSLLRISVLRSLGIAFVSLPPAEPTDETVGLRVS